MANILRPKRSNVAGNIPTTTNLSSGEMGVNMADQKVWINNGTSVVQIGAGRLSGLADVVLSSLATGQGLSWNGTNWVNSSAGSGTVTSLGVSGGTTGLTTSGGPITTSGTITLAGTLAVTNGGTGATTAAAALTALGAYAASNPSGYTSNTGTVTSVSGTGTVSGLTLSGTVTGSGSLTLGGTLSLTSGQVTAALGFTPYNSTNPSAYISNSALSSALSSYLPLGGGTLIGLLASERSDTQRVFESRNTSAASPAQFFIEHSFGNVNIGNLRGVLNVSSGALQQGGNQVLHAGNFSTFAVPLSGNVVMTGALVTANNVAFASRDTAGTNRNMIFISADNFMNIVNGGNVSTRILNQAQSATLVTLSDASGNFTATGNVTAFSDERLKTNWRDMPEDFVARLAKVKVGIYDRVDQENVTQVGISAQSFQKLLPQAIMTANDEMGALSVSYGNAALASAVELAKDNVDLRARVAKLEALVSKLSEG